MRRRKRQARAAARLRNLAGRPGWRLMTTLAKVDRRGPVPIFLTLTYPGQWEPDGRVWKEHLNRFWKKAVRRFEKLAAPWKLEPQMRLAPHFHALCFGVSRIPWQWVAVSWACIIHGVKAPRAGGKNGFPMGPGKTGAAEFRHWLDNVCKLPEEVKESIRVGTKIEKLRSWRGVVSYVAKYLAKAVPGAWERVGRYWGVIGRKDMPWSRAPENFVDYRTAVLMRRTARRYLRSRGIRVPHQCRRISIITDNMDVWLRMCEACCGAAVQRVKSAGPAAWVNVTREDIERVASSGPCRGRWRKWGVLWLEGASDGCVSADKLLRDVAWFLGRPGHEGRYRERGAEGGCIFEVGGKSISHSISPPLSSQP